MDAKQKVRSLGESHHHRRVLKRGGGSVGRAAAGAIRIGNAVGAAFTGRRVLEPVEARLTASVGTMLLLLAVLFAVFPRALAYPILIILVWFGLALLYRSCKLYRKSKRKKEVVGKQTASRRVQKPA